MYPNLLMKKITILIKIKFKTQIQELIHYAIHTQRKKIARTNIHKRDKNNSKLRKVFTDVIGNSDSFSS